MSLLPSLKAGIILWLPLETHSAIQGTRFDQREIIRRPIVALPIALELGHSGRLRRIATILGYRNHTLLVRLKST
ncbi:hypothetical protein GGS21DRAFT_524807 [Xylaria nigripes]|nr:hypothetical protein GGS21DRAFT_524807 [Xylaria nigripes]